MTITNDTYLKARLKHLEYDRDTLREQLNVWFAKLEEATEEINRLHVVISEMETRLGLKPCQFTRCVGYLAIQAENKQLKDMAMQLERRALEAERVLYGDTT